MTSARRVFFPVHFAAALACLLYPLSGLAYEHPLVQSLPVPEHGPHVAEIELRTPYWQVVEASHEKAVGYSAQQAGADYRRRGDFIQVRVKVLFTPTYSSASDDFWRQVSVALVQRNHRAATSVSAELLYAGDPNGDATWVTGANVFVNFRVAGLDSDSVKVEVLPPERAYTRRLI
jgi:hypothetical protein